MQFQGNLACHVKVVVLESGKLDVVIANSSDDTVWVDLQSGAAAFSPDQLNLASYLGTTSAPQTKTLSNPAGVALAITSIATSSDFAQTNNCPVGGSLPPESSCKIQVSFTPTVSKTVSGTVSVTDNGPGSPQTVLLTGTVQDFTIAATSQTSLTVTPGQAANYAIEVSPVNGFNQTVQLSCSGTPPQATCTVTPSSVTLDGSNTAPANIAVVTTAAGMGFTRPYGGSPANRLAVCLGLLGSLIALTNFVGSRRRKRRPQSIYRPAFLCLLAWGLTISGCGGGSTSGTGTAGTPSGNYNLIVTGTFTTGTTKLTHATDFTLVVQ